MDEIVRATREEMLAVVTSFDDSAAAVDAARDEDQDVLARGIRVRTIYPTTIRDCPITWSYAVETAALGEQIRLSDDVPARLVLCDHKVAVIPVDEHDLDAGALVVWARPVVATLAALFELCWARAVPAFEPGSQDDDLSERERRLLGLLSAGAKDATTARHVARDVRTVRREIAVIMQQLGAATRFQAGVLAARRGWV